MAVQQVTEELWDSSHAFDGGPSILIVEDNADVRRFYCREFERAGCEVRVATNGREALVSIQAAMPDVVLLDLKMPEMDGFEVLGAMRGTPALSTIPVVILSARGDPTEIERALTLGARDYLVKSATTPDKVVERIRSLLGEPGRPLAQVRYRLHVDLERGDAARLVASFLGDNGPKCPACGTEYVLDLTPDFSHTAPTFTAHFVCPKCSPAASLGERRDDGTHCCH